MTLTPARRIIAIVAVIAIVVGGIIAALSWVKPFEPGVQSGPFSAAAISSTAAAKPRVLLAPFPAGQTWYVCQGYGIGSHSGAPDLDLVYSKNDISKANDGCNGGAKSSTGKTIVAPATGRVYWRDDLTGSICFNFDSGGSMMFTHLNLKSNLAWNVEVKVGKPFGTVAGPVPGVSAFPRNNNVHLHLSAWKGQNCVGDKVPFAESAGMRLTCARNFTDDDKVNQWASHKVTSCKTGKLGGVNMQKACDVQYPDQGRKAKVTNPNDAASWRCVIKKSTKPIDVKRACRFEYAQTASAKVADSRNPYSWYCLR